MAEEVELKLALAPSQRSRLLRHPLLKQAVSSRQQVVSNVYYDTPDLALHGRGIALRIRRQGDQWLQTVKCAGASAGGLSSRPEWEVPYTGAFDFSAVSAPKVRRFLEAQLPRLLPCFATDFKRTTWRFEPATGQAVLMMMDHGLVQAGGREAIISEVELELDGGTVAQLFSLAEILGQRIALVPEPLSKAERGYRLAADSREKPAKAGAVVLSSTMVPADAFRQIALACLDHWLGNQSGVLTSDDPEFIHQMRVAVRRLRAALKLFAQDSPDPSDSQQVLSMLTDLMAVLGKARDMDVLAVEILPPVLADSPEDRRLIRVVQTVETARAAAREAVAVACQSPAYGSLLLALLRLLHGPVRQPESLSLPDFARQRLKTLRKRVQRRAAEASVDDPLALHRLRIAIKRLRYSLEFFSPLLKAKSSRKLMRSLAAQQEKLGALNDRANMIQVLTQVGGRAKPFRQGVDHILDWHRPCHEAMTDKLFHDLARLRRLPAIELRKM